MKISRRSFLKTATAIGASLAWSTGRGSRSTGMSGVISIPRVASGDSRSAHVILWTRHPFAQAHASS